MREIKVVTPGSLVKVDVDDNATLGDVAREARVDETLVGRYGGRQVSPDERDSTRLGEGDTIVFSAPALKHG